MVNWAVSYGKYNLEFLEGVDVLLDLREVVFGALADVVDRTLDGLDLLDVGPDLLEVVVPLDVVDRPLELLKLVDVLADLAMGPCTYDVRRKYCPQKHTKQPKQWFPSMSVKRHETYYHYL